MVYDPLVEKLLAQAQGVIKWKKINSSFYSGITETGGKVEVNLRRKLSFRGFVYRLYVWNCARVADGLKIDNRDSEFSRLSSLYNRAKDSHERTEVRERGRK